jgi:hypothetical protein
MEKERAMSKQTIRIVLGLLVLFGLAQQAHAGLTAVGPNDSSHGFPLWYQDSTGRALELCLSPATSVNGPMCELLTGTPPIPFKPDDPIAFPANFPEESFWFLAEANIDLGGGRGATYQAAVGAAFANGPGVAGEQLASARIRVRVDVPRPGGNYRVIHPYGVENFPNVAPGVRAINFTATVGGETAGGPYNGALAGAVGPFLTRAEGPISITTGALTEQFIGDPNIAEPVTGSPLSTNFFRIEGPNIGGPGIDFVETSLFFLAGKLFSGPLPTPLTVDHATYARTVSGQVDVFATSAPAATLTFSGGHNLPGGNIPLTGNGLGQFFASLPLTNASTLPAAITVTANLAGRSQTVVTGSLVDVVTISKAEYNPAALSLTIEASSSDQGITPPTLSAQGFTPGALATGAGVDSLVLDGVLAPPATVTVSSSAGGSATTTVIVVSSGRAPAATTRPVAINDTAATSQDVARDIKVLANDSAPNGFLDVTSVEIVSNATNGNALVNSLSGVVSYVPNPGFVGTDAFSYKVRDSQGALSNKATVTVQIGAVPEALRVTLAQFRTVSNRWRVDGVSSVAGATITIFGNPNFRPPILGTAVANGLGLWGFRSTTAPAPGSASNISVRSSGGASSPNVPVSVNR